MGKKRNNVVFFYYPTSVSNKARDYGDLEISSINFRKGRSIKEKYDKDGHIYDQEIDGDDYIEPYYAYDDDHIRHPTCSRVSWQRLTLPNCNTFHELDKNISVIK